MSVYVDNLVSSIRSRQWPYSEACHLLADSVDELYEFAWKLGLKTRWCHRGTLTHFDLTRGMRYQAIRLGAIEIGPAKVHEMIKEARLIKTS
jgi:hypothetical protein